MRVLSRTKKSVTFVVNGRACTVTRGEFARVLTRVQAAETARQASNREVSPGRVQAIIGAQTPADPGFTLPANSAHDYGLTVGRAQPARVGFGQSDAAYAPAVTGVRRPNVGGTESALTGRISPVRKIG